MKRHVTLHARGLADAGITARVLYSEDARFADGALGRRMPGAFLLASQMARLRAERPDVVNVHTLSAPAWLAARRLGITRSKMVIMSYGADERAMRPARGILGRMRRWRVSVPARALFPGASGIWCVNSEDAAYYEHEYRVSRDRIAVLPHAIEDRFFEPSSEPRDWSRLLFVGTPIHRKGFDVLLAAVSLLMARRPDVSVVLAGTLSECAEQLRAVPEPLRKRIRVLPVLDDHELRHVYHACGLILIPSRFEGLPFSLLEAMACGCPALAAANSGMLDVIRDGETGWLHRDFDPQSWANHVEALLTDGATLRRASTTAREYANQFRLGLLTQRALDWYRSLS
jgi:glycosyltransferase involved in cell wall biosynthesis